MIPALADELSCALYALLFGLLVGLFYDGMRVLFILLGIRDGGQLPPVARRCRFPYLKAPPPPEAKSRPLQVLLLVLCDTLFALSVGVGFCIFLYGYHDGVFRLFLLIAALIGASLYFLTLGRMISRVTGTLAFFVRVLLSYLFLCVRAPLLFLARLCLFFLRFALCALLSLLARLLSPLASSFSLFAAGRTARAFFKKATQPE